MKSVYNFSAGPSMLPKEVLSHAQNELDNWKGLGVSVMEISHRSQVFIDMVCEAEKDLRELLNIPDSYKVLFCQGGARGQFSAIPMNLLHQHHYADYIDSGYWSNCALIEAKKYCTPKRIYIKTIKDKKISLLPYTKWNIDKKSKYIHYCPNETIDGISIHDDPVFYNHLIIGDFSSCILSRPINISNYALIYAGAQKNIGPSGITLIILREDLIKSFDNISPSILNYRILSQHSSMFNTPTTFSWYLSGLVFKWLKDRGGLKKIEKLNQKKSDLLYKFIDNSSFYTNMISKKNRSQMNVVFDLINPKLNNTFLNESEKFGLYALKGHCIVGGMRASIYNAMPLDGVKSLIRFMLYFENKYG